jgi:hypothetical protein
MDQYQAASLIGLDGPDTTSPASEIRAEIARLEVAQNPHQDVLARVKSLRKMLKKAK